MSDTPRSDEESFSIDRLGVWRYAPDGGYTKASFSRRLERENAALREENRKAHDMACEDAVERYRLNGENAALRKLVEHWYKLVPDNIRSAIKDAQEEGQP